MFLGECLVCEKCLLNTSRTKHSSMGVIGHKALAEQYFLLAGILIYTPSLFSCFVKRSGALNRAPDFYNRPNQTMTNSSKLLNVIINQIVTLSSSRSSEICNIMPISIVPFMITGWRCDLVFYRHRIITIHCHYIICINI